MPLFYNALEAAAHRLSIVPPMFDYFGAMGLHALVAAARTGIFDALRERPSTGGELAAALNLEPTRPACCYAPWPASATCGSAAAATA